MNECAQIVPNDHAKPEGTITHLHTWRAIWPPPHSVNKGVENRPNSPFKFLGKHGSCCTSGVSLQRSPCYNAWLKTATQLGQGHNTAISQGNLNDQYGPLTANCVIYHCVWPHVHTNTDTCLSKFNKGYMHNHGGITHEILYVRFVKSGGDLCYKFSIMHLSTSSSFSYWQWF